MVTFITFSDLKFLNLARGEVNVRSNYAKLGQISKIKIFLQKHVQLFQFCLSIQLQMQSLALLTVVRKK